jgi:cellobiose-specific phosphotransferase system component IIC
MHKVDETSNIQLMAERLESLKAGIVGGLSLCLAFAIACLINNFLLARYLPTLASLRINTVNLQFLISAGIAGFSGLLFGVTYRYIVRCDRNPQLKAGGVLAFGLVRGLTQVDAGLNSGAVLSSIILGLESILWFVMAAIALDFAIQLNWIKPFQSS